MDARKRTGMVVSFIDRAAKTLASLPSFNSQSRRFGLPGACRALAPFFEAASNPILKISVMRILLSAYACRPNAGSEPGVGWNWATHLAARGIEVHVLVAKRNQEAIEAGLRDHPVRNLHFAYVAVPYEWAKKSEALHYICWQVAALHAARELARKFEFHVAH